MFGFAVSLVLLIIGIVKTEYILLIAAGLYAVASAIFWSVLILASKFNNKNR